MRGRELDVLAPFVDREAADAGTAKRERHKLTTTTMSDTSNFSLANRKQLADMLGTSYDGLRERSKRIFREKEAALYAGYLNEYAEKKHATGLVTQIKAAQRASEEYKRQLAILGFELSGDDLELVDGSDNPLDKIINARVEKQIGTTRAIDARFDSAQIAMMTVATLQDAEKLLKAVSEV